MKNNELGHYATDQAFVIKFDEFSKPFVVQENGKVMFMLDHCRLNSFRYDKEDILKEVKSNQEFKDDLTDSNALGVSKGVKVDHKNNNWILMNNYLSLPFSYLSFAMLDKFEARDDYF